MSKPLRRAPTAVVGVTHWTQEEHFLMLSLVRIELDGYKASPAKNAGEQALFQMLSAIEAKLTRTMHEVGMKV